MNKKEIYSLKRVSLNFVKKYTNFTKLSINDFDIEIVNTEFSLDFAFGTMNGYLTAYNFLSVEGEKELIYKQAINFLSRANAQIIVENVIYKVS